MRKNHCSILNCEWFAFKLLKQIFLFLIPNFLLVIHLSAQSVSVALDRDKILLGEQVTLQLNITGINPDSSFISSWPQINDTINHLEILKRSEIDTIAVNGLNSYQQNFTITSFDSGKWQLGPLDFLIQNKVSGKQIKVSSPAVLLTVLPVDVSGLKDYHPIKDIIEVEPVFNWWPIIIAIGIIIIALIVYIVLKNRKKKIAEAPKPVLRGTALERAIEKLMQLQKQTLHSNEEIKKFHSEIDFICRQYFEEAANVKAMQATTSELFSRMSVYMQYADLRGSLRDIFDLNASVKFAKYFPSETESKNILSDVITSLQKVDVLVQQAKSNADRMVSKY